MCSYFRIVAPAIFLRGRALPSILHRKGPVAWFWPVIGSFSRIAVAVLGADPLTATTEPGVQGVFVAIGGAMLTGRAGDRTGSPPDALEGRTPRCPYLEGFTVSRIFRSDQQLTVTEAAIIRSGQAFDPQLFDLDPDAANQFFRGSAVSGRHRAALTMRLLVDSGFTPAGGIVGAGFEDLSWPVRRPGDTPGRSRQRCWSFARTGRAKPWPAQGAQCDPQPR